MMPDDPIFDPIYALLVARGKPLMAHLADPIDGWLPLYLENSHYSYFARNPEFHLYGKSGHVSHAALIAARDQILEKHPRLVVVGAHLGSLEHDLDELAKRLDRYPNFHVAGSSSKPKRRRPDSLNDDPLFDRTQCNWYRPPACG